MRRRSYNTVLLLDCNNLGHVSFHTTGELTHKGVPTGVIYGFLRKLIDMCHHHNTGRVLFFWDGANSRMPRRTIFPEYKGNRERTEKMPKEQEDMYWQFDTIRHNILPALGLGQYVFQKHGMEADDLIACAVKQLPGHELVIGSGDTDMYQLLSKSVSIAPLGKGSVPLVTEKDFRTSYGGLGPSDYVTIKAMAGDASDNIPGIVKVGEKTAVKYLKGELKNTTKTWEALTSDEGMGIVRRNRNIIRLPFRDVPLDFPLDEGKIRYPMSCSKRFASVFEEYGLHTFLRPENFKRWAEFFC